MKHYTIGEIFRLKLLKGWDGKPYKNKVTVSRAVNKMRFKIVRTKFGSAKAVTASEIEKFNRHS